MAAAAEQGGGRGGRACVRKSFAFFTSRGPQRGVRSSSLNGFTTIAGDVPAAGGGAAAASSSVSSSASSSSASSSDVAGCASFACFFFSLHSSQNQSPLGTCDVGMRQSGACGRSTLLHARERPPPCRDAARRGKELPLRRRETKGTDRLELEARHVRAARVAGLAQDERVPLPLRARTLGHDDGRDDRTRQGRRK